MPCEDEGRDWGDASTSQETPKIANERSETRKWHETDSSSQPLEATDVADTLISNF